jgi:hypothetical protein
LELISEHDMMTIIILGEHREQERDEHGGAGGGVGGGVRIGAVGSV